MGLTDELEALRQIGRVKTNSEKLSSASAPRSTPESEAERLRQKAASEKTYRNEAYEWLHSARHSGEEAAVVSALYRRLLDERKRRSRERREGGERGWGRRGSGSGNPSVGDGGEGCGAAGEDGGAAAASTTTTATTNEDEEREREREREELRMNMEALEMLPNHVVAALRARYETSDGLLALSRALEEAATEECDAEDGGCGGGGKERGVLARLVEAPYDEFRDRLAESVGRDDDGGAMTTTTNTTNTTKTTNTMTTTRRGVDVDVDCRSSSDGIPEAVASSADGIAAGMASMAEEENKKEVAKSEIAKEMEEVEEGAREVDGKSMNDEEEVPVVEGGVDAKEDDETRISLGEQADGATKHNMEEGAMEVETNELEDEVSVEGVDATKEEDETRTSLDEPVEELRERIENLSIDEDGFDRLRRDGGGATDTVHAEDEREERGDAEEEKETMETMTTTMMMMGCGSSEGIEMIIAPPGDEGGTESERRLVPSSSSSSSSSSLPSNERMIERTRVFYDVHSPEYARDVLDIHYETLCPAVHRDAFLSHVRRQRRSAHGGAKDALHDDDDDDHRPATTTIIDVGCGCGRDARHFASMGHNVLGIDFSTEMLKRAREDASGAHFLRMDVRDLKRSLVDESVDGAWAHLSLMHLQRCDALDVLGGLRSAARVGGVLFVSLEMGNDDDDYDGSLVFEIDERYAASENVPPFHPGLVASDENEVATGLAAVDADDDDTRRKLCSYYTMTQARELLTDSGWDVIDMGEDDRREMSEYVTHSMLYAFATRRK